MSQVRLPYSDAECATLRIAAEAALATLRPVLHGDGGDAHVAEVTPGGIAIIAFEGACQGCPASAVTMRLGIERALLSAVPELKGVQEAPRTRPAGTRGRYDPAADPDESAGNSASRRSGAMKSPFDT